MVRSSTKVLGRYRTSHRLADGHEEALAVAVIELAVAVIEQAKLDLDVADFRWWLVNAGQYWLKMAGVANPEAFAALITERTSLNEG